VLPPASPTPESLPVHEVDADDDDSSLDLTLEELKLEPESNKEKGKQKEVAHDVWAFFDRGKGRSDNRTCKLCM
jgi:hypothetical protein